MEPIKSKEDLEKILDSLYNQGFGHISISKLHENKVNHIISKTNKLGVKYEDQLFRDLDSLKDYDEIQQKAEAHFSKFSPNDKIKELFNTFSISADGTCQTPSNEDSIKDVITWVEFKNKYGLKDVFGKNNSVSYYNLDKNYIKIYFGDERYKFMELYQLLFNEKSIKELDYNSNRGGNIGSWFSLGKIEIKFFASSYAYIRGDISKFKDYYYNKLKDTTQNHVIKFNGNTEIINGSDPI